MKKLNKQRVTLQEVARHAGVSTSTASLVVRNNPRISEATRKKVLQSMEDLGYVYDRVAANMRSKSSNIVGVIVTDISNTFISEFLIGVQTTLESLGYTVLLGTTFDSVDKQERLISTMIEHRVGGIILNLASKSSTRTVKQLNQIRTPKVLANRELADVHCDYVGADYEQGTWMAVHHLLQKGHRRIAFLGGIKSSSTWIERMKGFKRAHDEANLTIDESLIIDMVPTREGGKEALTQVIDQPEPPTAIFCFSDLVAFGVIQELAARDIKPGEDIDVVGFDNIPEAELYHPPLTTVSSFPRSIGVKAANLLYQKMNEQDEELQRVILKPQLHIRETSTSS
ncbi:MULTISPECIES: LacI family DNA-binding transcriptional regulator [Bacillus]|uniref:LacI family transcriptional regulator n=1 Tax=Bacillus zhangzhouensis TaxID=1178540 RepID=A0A081L8T1_9BACI|nr:MULTISPECIES: LacI family DNA-binding transcriptional regulator [Bacillus]KEP25657.1 LacI family transcriptional regulator [Bacillus zhangzhouensis]MDR0124180.1 LacI family DNA-binding transcriptional regulator [Bacillus zhangzhouensis]PRO39909.1 LacI family DNA-binding transcriptional regulator [Bacillus sp. LLTC93]